jgi:hypothetical protein
MERSKHLPSQSLLTSAAVAMLLLPPLPLSMALQTYLCARASVSHAARLVLLNATLSQTDGGGGGERTLT